MDKGAAVLKCDFCGKIYKSKRWFENHMKTHIISPTGTSNLTENSGRGESAATTSDSNVSLVPSSQQPSMLPHEDESLLEASIEAEHAANMDWGDWYDEEDDDEEAQTYYELLPWEDDEEEERNRSNVQVQGVVQPQPKKQKTAALIKCPECKVDCQSLDGYIKHRIGHGMKAALLRLPPVEELEKDSPALGRAVFLEMSETSLIHGPSTIVASAAKDLSNKCDSAEMLPFWKLLYDGFCTFLYSKRDFLFPSALATAFYENSSKYTVNQEARQDLISVLCKCSENVQDVSEVLLGTFLIKFSNKLLAHILRLIGKGAEYRYEALENRYTVTYQPTKTTDFQQNMHYIGGSNVKSVLKTALRVKRTDEWNRVILTLRNNFLINELAAAPQAELRAWTEAKDRGKLTNISGKALEFFVQLGTEVKPLERLDGSIIWEEVVNKITNSPSLLLRWDELKGSLSEKESFKLLHALTKHFCVTWRNGVMGRRHDEMALRKNAQKHGTGGLAFRATLGGK